jgi:predicted RecB family endonuclease
MYFDLLKVILEPGSTYGIFLDIKDTRSAGKVAKLHEVLTNNMYDFARSIVRNLQNVHSHEIEVLQLCDLLIGTVSYVNRGLTSSPAKQELIRRMRERSGYRLTWTTLLKEDKVNLFRWKAGEAEA